VRTIQMAAARASEVKVELMDCGDSIVRDRASSFVLGTAGIGPATAPALSLNLNIRAGYVIDLSGRQDDTATVPTIPDNQAGVVIEHE
jgi:hypothetical protein